MNFTPCDASVIAPPRTERRFRSPLRWSVRNRASAGAAAPAIGNAVWPAPSGAATAATAACPIFPEPSIRRKQADAARAPTPGEATSLVVRYSPPVTHDQTPLKERLLLVEQPAQVAELNRRHGAGISRGNRKSHVDGVGETHRHRTHLHPVNAVGAVVAREDAAHPLQPQPDVGRHGRAALVDVARRAAGDAAPGEPVPDTLG